MLQISRRGNFALAEFHRHSCRRRADHAAHEPASALHGADVFGAGVHVAAPAGPGAQARTRQQSSSRTAKPGTGCANERLAA